MFADPRFTREYLAVHLLCVHGRPRCLLCHELDPRCSQRVSGGFSQRRWQYHIIVQRVLKREGEGPISRRFPTVASEAADGGGLARLR